MRRLFGFRGFDSLGRFFRGRGFDAIKPQGWFLRLDAESNRHIRDVLEEELQARLRAKIPGARPEDRGFRRLAVDELRHARQEADLRAVRGPMGRITAFRMRKKLRTPERGLTPAQARAVVAAATAAGIDEALARRLLGLARQRVSVLGRGPQAAARIG